MWRRPVDDYLAGLEGIRDGGLVGFALVVLAAVASWFVYVPIHELSHAFGCLAAGGEVSRLEIDPIYGAAWLQRVFPFVAVGSDYAGQLTGFDTHGNDLIYFVTDAAPFLFTVVLGVPLLRWSARGPRAPLLRAAFFGASIPWAFAPFVSITGDYYEMASLVTTRAYRWLAPGFPLERWRSDDLPLLVDKLWRSGQLHAIDFTGIALGALLGVVLCFATYRLGVAVADLYAAASPAREG